MVDKSGDQPRLQRLRKIETEMQEKFKGLNIFQSDAPEDYSGVSLEEKNKGKYMATFPFPYMNGHLHLGHAYSMSKAEFMIRYQKQLGKRVLFPFGFHCTGMPIQAASNRLKREITKGEISSNQPTAEEMKKNPKMKRPAFTQYEILQQLNIADEEIPKFQDPYHWFKTFPATGMEDAQAFGLAVDWRRSFYTTDKNPYFDSFVRWQFNHLKANGKITYAKRYTIFSELDNQPCADHDRRSGEGLAPQEYVGIKIELLEKPECFKEWQDKKIYLLAATLRSETMYGQTNCFVLPEGKYGLYEVKGDEFFVMSERAARNMAFQELMKEDTKYPCLQTIMGQELIGKKLKAPLSKYEFVYALPLTTIKMNKGTGVVTSVPSDSPDDFAMLKDLQTKKGLREKYNVEEEWVVPFDPIPIIEVPELGNMCAPTLCEKLKVQSHKDEAKLKEAKTQAYQEGFYKGVMIVGEFAGKKVEEAKPLVKEYLIKEGMAINYYEPEGEVVSRSGDDCVVALKFQWLLAYGEESWKKDVMDHVQSDRFNTYNPKTQHEFEKILNWLREWGCSRTAGLGTNLPWDDEFIVESLSDSTIYMAYYTVAHLLQGGVIDGSTPGPLGLKPEDMTMAAWDYIFLQKEYNAAECPGVTEEKLKKMRHEFEYWYPMDLRVSAKDLIRNHLTMSLYNHAAIWKGDNMEQRMTQNYFCNGYLNLNNEKMSKSTGNFMSMKQSIMKYGCDATRFALADAGDLLDDANFDDKVANAAILKLFTLEEWIQKYCPKDGIDWNAPSDQNKFGWDCIVDNELNRIVKAVNTAYAEMKIRNVLIHAFSELNELKESYRIASGGNINPKTMFRILETLITLLNPIIPLFCQYQWESVLVPALKKCQNLPKQPAELLVDQGWPASGEESESLSTLLKYLGDCKSNIRLAHKAATTGGKKKGKGKAEPEEEKPITTCVLFHTSKFPEYQQRVLDILKAYEFVDNVIQSKEYIVKIRAEFKVKKEADAALQFAAYTLKQAETRGTEATFKLEIPFEQSEVLEMNKTFLYENMPTITQTVTVHVDEADLDAKYPNSQNARDKATPLAPNAFFM